MHRTVYRFGNYELDPKHRELRHDGEPISLPLKSFDCLVYLVENRDRAIGRDELISAVWATVDLNANILAQALWRVRQALEDAGSGERTMIRTVPRFGYCWIAPTERIEVEVEPEPATVSPEHTESPTVAQQNPPETTTHAPTSSPEDPALHEINRAGTRARQPYRTLVAGALILAVAIAAAYFAITRIDTPGESSAVERRERAPTSDEAYLVLPVALDRDDPETAWIRLGVMDYIAEALRRSADKHVLPSDQVISLTTDMEGDAASNEQALQHLVAITGASHVVQSRAMQRDEGWHFVFDLHHHGTHHSYQGTAATPLQAASIAARAMLDDPAVAGDIQLPHPLETDELVQRVGAALLIGDLNTAQELIDSAPVLLEDQPQLRVHAGNVALRRGRLDEAERLFRPLTEDAELPLEIRANAWGGLGAVSIYRADFQAGGKAMTEAVDLLRESGESRLLGQAYLNRGITYAERREFAEAMADFGRARIELDRADDHIGMAKLQINIGISESRRGRHAEALAAQHQAIRIFTAFAIPDYLVISLHNQAYTQLALLDVPGALATSMQAMEQAEYLDNRTVKVRAAVVRTRAHLAAGQLREAETLITRFDTGVDAPDPGDSEFTVLGLDLLRQRGNFSAAAQQAEAAVNRIAGSEDFFAGTLLSTASWLGVDSALRAGRVDLAEYLAARLERAPATDRDSLRPVMEQLIQAELAHAHGADDVDEHYAAALAQAEERGDASTLITVAAAWLRYSLAAADMDRAASLAGRLAGYADRDYLAARALLAFTEASGTENRAAEIRTKVVGLAGERDPKQPF